MAQYRIRSCTKLFHGDQLDSSLVSYRLREEGIVADHRHTKPVRHPRNTARNLPTADQAKGQPIDPLELRSFGPVPDVVLHINGIIHDIAQQGGDQRHSMLSHLVEAVIWAVCNRTACRLCGIHVNIVHAHCIIADDLKLRQGMENLLGELAILRNGGICTLKCGNDIIFIMHLGHHNIVTCSTKDSNFCAAILMAMINNNNLHRVLPSAQALYS